MLWDVVFVDPGSLRPSREYKRTFEKVAALDPPRTAVILVPLRFQPVLLLLDAAIPGLLPAGTIIFPLDRVTFVPSSVKRLFPMVEEDVAFKIVLLVSPERPEPGEYWYPGIDQRSV